VNTRAPIIVMSAFAAICWTLGAAQFGSSALLISAVGFVLSGLVVAFTWRRRGESVARRGLSRRRMIVGIASAAEGVAIFATAMILFNLGRRDLIVPAVAIIVGLHFLPLARWLPAPTYYLTATLFVAIGMAGTVVQDLRSRILSVGIGAAAVLWLSCGLLLLRADRHRS